jgi:AbrB family looped-hinge helix DNA binding protein
MEVEMRSIAQVKQGGRVVIPAAIRKKFQMHPGSRIIFEVENEEIRLKTIADSIRRAQTLCAPYLKGKKDIVSNFLAKRRKKALRE